MYLKGDLKMNDLVLIKEYIGLGGGMLVVSCLLLTLIIKARIEWKLTRVSIIVFTSLFIWSIYRFIDRLSDVNIYDYLILAFNLGLFVVGYIVSRDVRQE